MGSASAISLTVGLILVGAAIGFWLMTQAENKARLRRRTDAEQFKRRLHSPDLDGLEQQPGHPLPASFGALYQNRDLIQTNDLLIAVPNPLEGADECYIAWFRPANVESLREVWPGCEGLFPIADNGAGDRFLVNLCEPDPEVVYYLHDRGERRGLGVALSTFLAAPRRPVPEEQALPSMVSTKEAFPMLRFRQSARLERLACARRGRSGMPPNLTLQRAIQQRRAHRSCPAAELRRSTS